MTPHMLLPPSPGDGGGVTRVSDTALAADNIPASPFVLDIFVTDTVGADSMTPTACWMHHNMHLREGIEKAAAGSLNVTR